jgi:hypothetical protein
MKTKHDKKDSLGSKTRSLPKTRYEHVNLDYLGGFLDGDGSIFAQIVRREDYKMGFGIRLSVGFYQKSSKHWYILRIQKYLKSLGVSSTVQQDKAGMSNCIITGDVGVKKFLIIIIPHLVLKKALGRLILEIIENKKSIKTEVDFIKVCALVDKTADYTYSKNRKITAKIVEDHLNSP